MWEISKIENGGSLSKCVVLPFPFVLGLCLIKFVNRVVTDKSMGTLRGLSEDFRQKEYQPRRSYSTIVADLTLVTLRLSRCSSEVASPTEMGRRLDVLCNYDSR
jgi:hypothetical protein